MGNYKDLYQLSKVILRKYYRSVPYRKYNYADSTKNPSSSPIRRTTYSFLRNGRDIYRNRILNKGGKTEESVITLDDDSNNSDDESKLINKNFDCNDFKCNHEKE
jgi:hypothetical protein